MSRPINPVDLDHAVELYLAGESAYQIAANGGVGRTALRAELTRRDIPTRGRSDAGLLRASKMTPAEREAQAAMAHAAARGSTRTYSELRRRAMAIEKRGRADSAGEQQMIDWLTEAGCDPVSQKAVGKYNVDIAVAPVAVEVLGGGWHSTKDRHATRTPHILDAGWHLIMTWDYEGRSALTRGAADYVIAFLDEVRRDPPSISQYRVIAGCGEVLASGDAHDDHFPLIPPPRGR